MPFPNLNEIKSTLSTTSQNLKEKAQDAVDNLKNKVQEKYNDFLNGNYVLSMKGDALLKTTTSESTNSDQDVRKYENRPLSKLSTWDSPGGTNSIEDQIKHASSKEAWAASIGGTVKPEPNEDGENIKASSVKGKTENITFTEDDIKSDNTKTKYAKTLYMSGALAPGDEAYYTLYNSLHRMDYFNPNIASDIHIFVTRPWCNFGPGNLIAHSSILQAASSREGCMLLASLMKCGSDENFYTTKDKDVGLDVNDTSEANEAWNKLKTYGLDTSGLRQTPFIPLLSNLSTSISGIKDIVLEAYEYDGDQAGHKTADAMGIDESQSDGECTISYYESSNMPVSMLTYYWLLYMDCVGKGLMMANPQSIQECFYDYMSSIYWFVTGKDGISIKLYGKLTGVMPTQTPLTSLIPNERGSAPDPKISITYHYNHSEIMDPQILYDFNYTIANAYGFAAQPSQDDYGSNNTISTYSNYKAISDWMSHTVNKIIPRNLNQNIYDGEGKENTLYRKYMKRVQDDSENRKATYNTNTPEFYPEIQNQWLGHPWVTPDGKLVYATLGVNNIGLYSIPDRIGKDVDVTLASTKDPDTKDSKDGNFLAQAQNKIESAVDSLVSSADGTKTLEYNADYGIATAQEVEFYSEVKSDYYVSQLITQWHPKDAYGNEYSDAEKLKLAYDKKPQFRDYIDSKWPTNAFWQYRHILENQTKHDY